MIEDHLVLKAMMTIKGNDDQEDKHCNNMKALVGIQMQQNLISKKRDTDNEVDEKRDGTTVHAEELADYVECC